jgi:hypothetical protein
MADPYLSEIKYLGGPTLDFIEIAVDVGADVSDLVVTIYLQNGNVRTSNPLAGLTPTTVGGKDVYVIDTTTSPSFTGLGKSNGVSLSDDTNVYAFVSFDDRPSPITATAGPANGLTSTQIGMAGAGESLETNDGGATYFVQTTPNSGTIPCLTEGTEIRTPDGAIKVEDLQPGMEVTTFDEATTTVVSVFSRTLTASVMARNAALYPVRISAGALGNGLPRRDLLVSRQHRMLVSSPIVERMFAVPEVLVAAIKLVEIPGIYVDTSVKDITYFHLLLAVHEIIFAEDAPTESLFLGDAAIGALAKADRAEIELLFPELVRTDHSPTPTRLIPRGQRQKQLVARHVANRKPLLPNLK